MTAKVAKGRPRLSSLRHGGKEPSHGALLRCFHSNMEGESEYSHSLALAVKSLEVSRSLRGIRLAIGEELHRRVHGSQGGQMA